MQDSIMAVIRRSPIEIHTFFETLSPELKQHSASVSQLAGEVLGWYAQAPVDAFEPLPAQEQLMRAALYHDVGLSLIPERILNKPDALTDAEFRVVQKHASYGGRLLDNYRSQCPRAPAEDAFWRLAAEIALAHHERWDGAGYPFGLRTTAIPLAARIVCAADAFISMVQGAPFRMSLPPEYAIFEIIQNADRQFDPAVSAMFQDHSEMILTCYKAM